MAPEWYTNKKVLFLHGCFNTYQHSFSRKYTTITVNYNYAGHCTLSELGPIFDIGLHNICITNESLENRFDSS
jgi:hypothetical protein